VDGTAARNLPGAASGSRDRPQSQRQARLFRVEKAREEGITASHTISFIHTQWPHEEQLSLAPAGGALLPYDCPNIRLKAATDKSQVFARGLATDSLPASTPDAPAATIAQSYSDAALSSTATTPVLNDQLPSPAAPSNNH
jgi:hypothetical protein